ncbi:MAG: cytochrome c oxidase subunit II [Phycisphaerales bacterium]|nr:cytochrome c oxidase subunit II [Planctomycetota bacterium]
MLNSLTSGWTGTLADGAQGWWSYGWNWFFRNYGANPNAVRTDRLYMEIFWISVGWFVFLMAIMFYFVIKYRRRPGLPAPYSPSHNTPLELVWTIIPCIFLVYIFLQGFHAYIDKLIAPGDSLKMTLTAMKWNWTVTYPNGASSPENTLIGSDSVNFGGQNGSPGSRPVPIFYMPAKVPVHFNMISKDVMHSFWVPDFRVKFDVFPNRYTTYWFEAAEPDANAPYLKDSNGKEITTAQGKKIQYVDHFIFCAEYCGDQHSEMLGIIRIVPMDYYLAKIEEWNIEGKTPEEIGKLVYQSQGCAACHTLDGSKGAAPTWKDLYMSQQPTNAGTVTADDNYIRESIYTPAAKIVDGYPSNMPVFTTAQIDERRMQGLIAYMKSISKYSQHGDAKTEMKSDAKPAPEKK